MITELALALSSAAVPAKVRSLTLADMVRNADAIAVARVIGNVELPLSGEPEPGLMGLRRSVKLGLAQPERWLKGEPSSEPLVFVNQGTWTCDITGAELGERALFFFTRESKARALSQRAQGYAERFGSRPLHYVTHSGRGQMALRAVAGRELATVWNGDVRLPKGAPIEPGPESEYSFIVSLDLAWLAPAVEEIRLAQKQPWIRAAALSGGSGTPWELVLRGDRTGTLKLAAAGAESSREILLEAQLLWRLDYAPAELAKLGVVGAFGDLVEGRWERELTLHADDATLEFRMGAVGGYVDRYEKLFESVWSPLVAGLDCAECMHVGTPQEK